MGTSVSPCLGPPLKHLGHGTVGNPGSDTNQHLADTPRFRSHARPAGEGGGGGAIAQPENRTRDHVVLLPGGRGLHSFTYQLNFSAVYGVGGAHRGCVARTKGVLGGV